jgi:hypothetical protein
MCLVACGLLQCKPDIIKQQQGQGKMPGELTGNERFANSGASTYQKNFPIRIARLLGIHGFGLFGCKNSPTLFYFM